DTHHVRWIEPDPAVSGRVFVAIEAGALVRTLDSGQTWTDRVPGGPYDTHTAATHRLAPGRVYSAAGDGYFESENAGDEWARRFATHPQEPGVSYAANNRGVFSSTDAGRTWKVLEIPWPQHFFTHGVEALVALPD